MYGMCVRAWVHVCACARRMWAQRTLSVFSCFTLSFSVIFCFLKIKTPNSAITM